MVASRLALGLLVACALVALVGPVWEARQRGPEAAVRAYLAAVEQSDLEGALETVAPEARAVLRERVENQLGSRYRVEVLALGNPSLLARALGASTGSAAATVLAEITPASGERWKSTTVVELVNRGGRWLLLDAPFA